MSDLAAEGLQIAVPAGWEGRIVGREPAAPPRDAMGQVTAAAETRTGVAHLASFPLPVELGDFGGGAVDLMGRRDIFLVLFEFGPESLGTPLFAAEGMPSLHPIDFDPATCRRSMPGQSAAQRFFVVNGRPFCLYVVLGSHARRIGLVPLVNEALADISIAPR